MKPHRLRNGQMIPRKKRKRAWRYWIGHYLPIDRTVLINNMRIAIRNTTCSHFTSDASPTS